jgi:hypothetical protein
LIDWVRTLTLDRTFETTMKVKGYGIDLD